MTCFLEPNEDGHRTQLRSAARTDGKRDTTMRSLTRIRMSQESCSCPSIMWSSGRRSRWLPTRWCCSRWRQLHHERSSSLHPAKIRLLLQYVENLVPGPKFGTWDDSRCVNFRVSEICRYSLAILSACSRSNLGTIQPHQRPHDVVVVITATCPHSKIAFPLSISVLTCGH